MKLEQNQKVNLSDLPPDGGPEYNRLIFHKSPYLLQHADNPVDWYPWGDEAFEKAKKENKPIFLSIGYSTCHWCHVMAHESFEDKEVAELLNKYFVAIKVDREERPDIDAIYMSVCISMTGRGGWPLTIIMTPDRKPFLAGTYFPKTDNFGRPGLMTLLARVNKLWNERREDLIKSGEKIVQSLQAGASQSKKGELTENTLKKAYETFQARFDENHGGFGGAPKFPSPHNLTFLLRWWYRTGEEKALQMVEKTLDEMRRGGMYDQIGYGFHRYSVDPEWLIPHFEKMLYDQALLALAYTEAYQATGKEAYAETVREIFTYVLRDMSSADGGFHSAENADSEGEEGKFYAWTPKEIKSALGENDGDLFCKFYGVTKKGNFEHGTSALHIGKPIEEFAKEKKIDAKELAKTLDRSRRKLLGVRDKRIRPSKDDKILTDWNGLMIAALAKGGRVLGEEKYIDAARRAADFFLATLIRKDGRLLHRYRDGEAAIEGFLDDYAFLVWGLLELYESTFDVKYLERAISFTNDMLSLFWDEKNGGLFLRVGDGEELITRIKEGYDGAIPSGNSIAALDLVRLWGMTMNKEYGEKAKELMESFGRPVNASPTGFTQLLSAFDFYLGPSYEIVIAGELEHENTRRMLNEIHTRFIPRKVVLLHQPGAKGKPLEELSPFIAPQTQMNDLPTAYVCQNFMCQIPTTDVRELGSLLTDNR